MRQAVAALLLLPACVGPGRQARAIAAATPAPVSREQVQALRWVEGRWTTERNAYLTTYLDFSFTSDSTIQLRLFESREFMVPYNTFEITLAEGGLRARSGSREWTATRVDTNGMHFIATARDVYQALGIRRLDHERARLDITWRHESDQVEKRSVIIRRFGRGG